MLDRDRAHPDMGFFPPQELTLQGVPVGNRLPPERLKVLGLGGPGSLRWEEQYSKRVRVLTLLPDCLRLNPLSYLTSACLVLLICKMGIITVPTPQRLTHIKHLEEHLVPSKCYTGACCYSLGPGIAVSI